jgi:hypothetical protein
VKFNKLYHQINCEIYTFKAKGAERSSGVFVWTVYILNTPGSHHLLIFALAYIECWLIIPCDYVK